MKENWKSSLKRDIIGTVKEEMIGLSCESSIGDGITISPPQRKISGQARPSNFGELGDRAAIDSS